jgi:CRP-like cAMP-binding protein
MTLTKDVEVLRNIPLFAKLEPATLKLLAFTSDRLRYLSGDELFHQGDYGDAVYIILDGKADILVDSLNGTVNIKHSARTLSAKSRSCATYRALRRWSRVATWKPCACRRLASSTWLRNFRRLASK